MAGDAFRVKSQGIRGDRPHMRAHARMGTRRRGRHPSGTDVGTAVRVTLWTPGNPMDATVVPAPHG